MLLIVEQLSVKVPCKGIANGDQLIQNLLKNLCIFKWGTNTCRGHSATRLVPGGPDFDHNSWFAQEVLITGIWLTITVQF